MNLQIVPFLISNMTIVWMHEGDNQNKASTVVGIQLFLLWTICLHFDQLISMLMK